VTRLAYVGAVAIAVIASLAFIGVHFAPKPMPWMPAALGSYLLVLVVGLIWALHPKFATAGSIRVVPYVFSVIGLVAFFVATSYYLFIAFWFAFGGKL